MKTETPLRPTDCSDLAPHPLTFNRDYGKAAEMYAKTASKPNPQPKG